MTIRVRAKIEMEAAIPKSGKVPIRRAQKPLTTGSTGVLGGERSTSTLEYAPVYFENKPIRSAVYDRESLVPRRRYTSPAVVTEYSATTVIPPGKKFWVDEAENLIISIK